MLTREMMKSQYLHGGCHLHVTCMDVSYLEGFPRKKECVALSMLQLGNLAHHHPSHVMPFKKAKHPVFPLQSLFQPFDLGLEDFQVLKDALELETRLVKNATVLSQYFGLGVTRNMDKTMQRILKDSFLTFLFKCNIKMLILTKKKMGRPRLALVLNPFQGIALR